MFQSKEFQRSIMPLIITNGIVCTGLLEYFIDRKIRTIGFIYFTCCVIYYVTLVLKFMNFYGTLKGPQETEVTKIISKIQFGNNIILYVVAIFGGLRRKKRLTLFLKQLETCKQEMDELNISRNYSSLYRLQCIASVILIFIILSMFIIDYYSFVETGLWLGYNSMIQLCLFDNYSTIITLITDLTFVFWIWYIKIKFGQLNIALQSMLTTTVNSPQHKRVLRMKDNWEDDSSLSIIFGTYKGNENLMKLKKIKQIHLELIKCARIINDAYGLQILISLSLCGLFIIELFYNAYALILINKIENWINQFYTLLYWILFFSIEILAINSTCQATVTEKYILIFLVLLYVLNTENILFELYEPSTSKKFRDEIRDFIFQLVKNRLTFTACRFFDLNHTYMYNIIGSITTYLIILIQVGDKPKVLINHKNNNSTSDM